MADMGKGTSMKDVTVTFTLDDIKLYDRARAIGLPSILISMYGDRIKKLLAEERESEREACAKECDDFMFRPSKNPDEAELAGIRLGSRFCAAAIRARGNT